MLNEEMTIKQAQLCDADEIYALYRSLIDAPFSTWSEDYPSHETVVHDVQAGYVLAMFSSKGQIISAISVLPDDEEPEFAGIAPWYEDVDRWAVAARLGVASTVQGRGIAGKMLSAAMNAARVNNCEGIRFLVAKRNPIAQRAYAALEFNICGECEMWGEQWLCYQKRL